MQFIVNDVENIEIHLNLYATDLRENGSAVKNSFHALYTFPFSRFTSSLMLLSFRGEMFRGNARQIFDFLRFARMRESLYCCSLFASALLLYSCGYYFFYRTLNSISLTVDALFKLFEIQSKYFRTDFTQALAIQSMRQAMELIQTAQI